MLNAGLLGLLDADSTNADQRWLAEEVVLTLRYHNNGVGWPIATDPIEAGHEVRITTVNVLLAADGNQYVAQAIDARGQVLWTVQV
jgi:hypothetical protein